MGTAGRSRRSAGFFPPPASVAAALRLQFPWRAMISNRPDADAVFATAMDEHLHVVSQLREQQPLLLHAIAQAMASAFGILAAFVKHSGRSPGTRINDLWIAAQAIENDYALLTANLKDFEGLPGLRAACP